VYLSCLKRFAGGPATLSGLSIAAGVCAAQALAELGVPDLRLKRPNDLLARGAKLAGILIEVQGEYDGPCTARVGVGVNLRLPDDLHESVSQPVIDLATLCDGTPPGRNAIAAALIRHLRAGLLGFERAGLAPFLADFARLDALAGQPLRLDGAGVPNEGTGRGINERGALRGARGQRHADREQPSVGAPGHQLNAHPSRSAIGATCTPQRDSAASSLSRASTQRAPSGVVSFFQNGACVLR